MIDRAGKALTRPQAAAAACEERSQICDVVAIDCLEPNGDAPAMSVLLPAGNENLVFKRHTLAWVLPVGFAAECAVISMGGRVMAGVVHLPTQTKPPPPRP